MPENKDLEERCRRLKAQEGRDIEEELRLLSVKYQKSFAEDKPPVIPLDYLLEDVCRIDPNINQYQAEKLIREKLEPDEIGRLPGFGGDFVHEDAALWFIRAYRYSLKLKNQPDAKELPMLPLKYTVDMACKFNEHSDYDQVKKLLRAKIRPEEIQEHHIMGPMVHEDAASWFIHSYRRSLKEGDKAWGLFFDSEETVRIGDLEFKQGEDGVLEPLGSFEKKHEPYELVDESAQKECSAEELQKAIERNDVYSQIFPFCGFYRKKCSQYAKDMISIHYTMSKPEVAAKFKEKTAEIEEKAEEFRKQYNLLWQEFERIENEVEDYENRLMGVITIEQSKAEKRFLRKKAEEGIELAKRFDGFNSQVKEWLTSVINQEWGIEFGREYERKITLDGFLRKIE